jgi:integrase/ribosomal protein S27AE
MQGETIAFVMQKALGLENKQAILNFLSFLEGQGYSENYQKSLAKTLVALDRHLEGRDFRKAREQDLFSFLARCRNPRTRATYGTRIKSFYRWLFTGNWKRGPYPKLVENIPTVVRKRELPVKSPNDLLTRDEILKLIDHAEKLRDKALIALLYDTGARPGEILNLRVKDVKLNRTHGEIYVNGKTGMRRIPIVFSIPYLERWLNSHPEKDNPEAKLFPKLKTGRGGDDLTEAGLTMLLKRIAKRAGIRRRMYAYVFRHSRLTELANILREHQLKAFAGWAAGSRMAEHYVRLAGLDLDSSLFEFYGIPQEKREPALKPRICPRCQALNEPNAVTCSKCGLILDERYAASTIEISHELRKEIEELKKIMNEYARIIVEATIMRDPENAKMFLRQHPELLKSYLEEVNGPFLEAYARKLGKSKEELLSEQLARLLSDEENIENFIRGLIRTRSSP